MKWLRPDGTPDRTGYEDALRDALALWCATIDHDEECEDAILRNCDAQRVASQLAVFCTVLGSVHARDPHRTEQAIRRMLLDGVNP